MHAAPPSPPEALPLVSASLHVLLVLSLLFCQVQMYLSSFVVSSQFASDEISEKQILLCSSWSELQGLGVRLGESAHLDEAHL